MIITSTKGELIMARALEILADVMFMTLLSSFIIIGFTMLILAP